MKRNELEWHYLRLLRQVQDESSSNNDFGSDSPIYLNRKKYGKS
jgi:hypothetical protein